MTQALTDIANQIGEPSGLPMGVRERGLGENLLNALPFALAQFGNPEQVNPIISRFQTTPEQEFEEKAMASKMKQDLLQNKLNALLGIEQMKRQERTLTNDEKKEAKDKMIRDTKEQSRQTYADILRDSGRFEEALQVEAGATISPVGGFRGTNAKQTRKQKIEEFRDNSVIIQEARTKLNWPQEFLDAMSNQRITIDEQTVGKPLLRLTSIAAYNSYWSTRIGFGGDPEASVNVDGFTLKGENLQREFILKVKEKLVGIDISTMLPEDKQVFLMSIAQNSIKFNVEEVEQLLSSKEQSPSATSTAISGALNKPNVQVPLMFLEDATNRVLREPDRQLGILDTVLGGMITGLTEGFGTKQNNNEPRVREDLFKGIK